MDKNTKYIARLMLKNKIYSSDGSKFEDLFTCIMRHHNPNFKQVKPQGSYGDRKNDGFDQITGTYYQVYAPENIWLKEKETINKLVSDFEGLYSYWQEITPIKYFYYVANDKYKGTYPSLRKELQKIRDSYPNINIDSFSSSDLENIFMSLDEDAMMDIVGFLPNFDNIELEFDVMKDVVEHLLSVNTNPLQETIPDNPDFKDKIIFNGLSEKISNNLISHRLNGFAINDFFELNSDFAKNDLREIFSGLYNEAKTTIEDSDSKSDEIFLYIYNKSYPSKKHTMAIDTAIFTLMSYYFEYCDIFETPKK